MNNINFEQPGDACVLGGETIPASNFQPLCETQESMSILRKEIAQVIKTVDELVYQSIVTAKFGDHWEDFALNNFDKEQLAEIAWVQGRRALLYERLLKRVVNAQ